MRNSLTWAACGNSSSSGSAGSAWNLCADAGGQTNRGDSVIGTTFVDALKLFEDVEVNLIEAMGHLSII